MKKIDTSIEGYKYIGINLTEEQYKKLTDLNVLIMSNDNRRNNYVFNIVLVLKILNLLPSEIVNKECDSNSDYNLNYDSPEFLQKVYGKLID